MYIQLAALFLFTVPITCFITPPPCRKGALLPSSLYEMKRPILDQVASALFRLENERVAASSEVDEKGRVGEPMEWSDDTSVANKFSEIVVSNPIGYGFKQWVADIVAGDFDQDEVGNQVESFVSWSHYNMNTGNVLSSMYCTSVYGTSNSFPVTICRAILLPSSSTT